METYTITVYQADEEDLCTITFDTNGGKWNNSLNGTHKFVMGHELWPEGQDLSVPTRNGYVFEGWTPAVSRVVSDDATYTAQWKQVGSNLTPVYVYLQVDGDTSGLILNYSGWYTVGVIYMPSDLVPNTGLDQGQTVNLNNPRVAQALDEAMKSIVRYGPNESLVIDDATWTKLHVQAGANDYVAEGSAWHLDGEIDAKYLANLTVNHIDMDTQEIMRTDTSVRTVGTSVNPDDMVRSFKNYTYDHSNPDHAITIQKDGDNVINIYYQKNADRLFYDANGGEGTMSPSVGKAEEQVTVKKNEFTRDGYEFTGWNIEADGSGKDYDPGDKYTLTDGEDKLFAQWTADPANIVFDANGGQDAPEGISGTTDEAITAEFPADEPTRTGYTFIGWNTQKDGTGTEVTAYPEKFAAGTTTYYAQWEKDDTQTQPTKYTVRHVVGGEVKDSRDFFDTAWILEDEPMIAIVDGSLDQNYYEGYKYDRTVITGTETTVTEGQSVASETVIDLIYVADTTNLSVTGYEGVYDAAAHGVTVNGTIAGDEITYTVNGEESNNQFVNVSNGTKVNVTVYRGGVAIWNGDATVTITPAPLTITTPSATKVYDGTALTAGPATIEGLLGDDVATVTATGSRTAVGKSTNTYQITWGEDTLSANYTIVETLGVLAVTQASINPDDPDYAGIKVNYPKDVMYAGFDQTWRPIVTTEDGTVLTPGVDYTVSYSKDDRANVTGDIVVTITGIGNYSGTVTRVYEILPRPVVINVNDAQKIYGTNDPTFTGSVSGVIAPDDLGTVTYFRTNADEAAGVYEDVITAEVSDLNPNYYVQRVNPGTFTIVKADGNAVNVVNADELCKIYDGESVSVIGAAAQPGSTVLYSTDGENWSTTSPSFTDADTYTVYVMATHPNFTDAGPITVTVTIWPRPVVLTSATDQKVYDGTALTNDEVTVGGMGFVDGQGATYDVTGSQAEVGSSDNAFTYTLNEGTDEKNYNIATVFGTLTVTAQTIDPSDPDDPSYMGVTISDPEDVIYNSEEQRWEPVVTTADGTVLQAGVDYEVTWSDDVTNVGTVTVTITGVGNFTGTVVKTYQILPAPLTVTTPSAQKVYDGEPLVAGPAELEGVQGDDAIFAEATGSQTEVGSSTNTVKMTWNGLAANYDVTYRLGTLTVLPVPEEPEGNEPGTGTDKPGTGTESGTGTGSEQIPGTGDITSQLPAALGVAGVAAVAIGAYVIKRRKDGTQ